MKVVDIEVAIKFLEEEAASLVSHVDANLICRIAVAEKRLNLG